MRFETGTSLDGLIGRRVLSVKVSDKVLVIETEVTPISVRVEGDCCSETWFSDIVGVESLIGCIVTAIDDVDSPATDCSDGRCRQESDSAYAVRLVTNDGSCEIVYRCSSNGYYGGWMESCDASELDEEHELIIAEWHSSNVSD